MMNNGRSPQSVDAPAFFEELKFFNDFFHIMLMSENH